ncbi:HAMP domain-containing sensor histidine kinase [Paenibacillus dendritiformis]|uniref:sensor histidine kinase n=1 Tax=Paenibacillus TaxID=44249 RepID=UPI00248C94EE|nr:HAMP domain-containing sensor histidine kinase [Paenibacillus dendritiformis]WGU93640.1 HAMP domain-containing sensor histidine kinase [Paenibacillus dendritiformis]
MMRTLYVRVVLTFLFAVIAGIIVAFAASGFFFEREMREIVYQDLTQLGNDMVRLYQQVPEAEFRDYLDSLKSFEWTKVHVFDSEGNAIVQHAIAGETLQPIEAQVVNDVLSGRPYHSTDPEGNRPAIGISFLKEGERHALFLQMAYGDNHFINRLILFTLGVVLAAGSLCFLVAARYVVRPIKKMTEATKRMAKGDFSTKLSFRRKDEIGVLAASFNHMAQELGQMEQMRQDFVSSVSHEIQSPLTSIYGFSKALCNRVVPEADQDRYLEIMMMECERLSRLSDNLLQLASLDSEHHPFAPRIYRLDGQLRQVIVAAEPQRADKELRLEEQLDDLSIEADEDLMSLVWTNLIGNAIKFTPENGMITVSLARQDGKALVTIADNGIGIVEEDRARVFERFFKADKARRRNAGGSGLGLAIVKKVVTLHHGTIRLDSEPGQGTTVSVTLPIRRNW